MSEAHRVHRPYWSPDLLPEHFSDISLPLHTHEAKGSHEQLRIFFFWLWSSLESAQMVALDRSPQQRAHSCAYVAPTSCGKLEILLKAITYPAKDDSLVFKGLLQGQHWPFNLTATQNGVEFTKNCYLTPLSTGRENKDLGQFMEDKSCSQIIPCAIN